jgi:hypothetical protein
MPGGRRVLAIFLLAGLMLGGCIPSGERGTEEGMTERPIEEVLEEHTPGWMEIDGVVGTGIGLCDETPCIRIFLARESEEIRRAIPEEVGGHPVDVVVTGPFRPR